VKASHSSTHRCVRPVNTLPAGRTSGQLDSLAPVQHRPARRSSGALCPVTLMSPQHIGWPQNLIPLGAHAVSHWPTLGRLRGRSPIQWSMPCEPYGNDALHRGPTGHYHESPIRPSKPPHPVPVVSAVGTSTAARSALDPNLLAAPSRCPAPPAPRPHTTFQPPTTRFQMRTTAVCNHGPVCHTLTCATSATTTYRYV
jgi:hypothetical protein